MTHLAGRCDCGRKIHLPKNTQYGDEWKCWTCGKVWVFSDHGKPVHVERSKAPPSDGTSSGGGTGCLILVIPGLMLLSNALMRLIGS